MKKLKGTTEPMQVHKRQVGMAACVAHGGGAPV